MHRHLSSRDLFFSAMASVVGRQLEQQQEEHPELQERAGSKTAEQGGMDQNQVGRGTAAPPWYLLLRNSRPWWRQGEMAGSGVD